MRHEGPAADPDRAVRGRQRGEKGSAMAGRHRGHGAMTRRDLLQTLAVPAAAALVSGCHGGQGPEPVHPPVAGGDGKAVAAPEPLSPPIVRVREFPIPPGTAPAVVFRALEQRKR